MPIFRKEKKELDQRMDAPSVSGDEDPHTRMVTRKSGLFSEDDNDMPTRPTQEEKTRLYRPGGHKRDFEAEQGAIEVPDFMADPVVGWLVVIAGPGKGAALKLGYGMNEIGRAKEARVSLNFGDTNVSRRKHAVLTYDPRGRKSYLQQGEGANLCYLENKPVLTPTEIKTGDEITIGDTRLVYISLCNEEFDWQDL